MDINYKIRQMERSDIDQLHKLLAANNWNMERSYLECVFDTDPRGLIVVEKNDGEIMGQVASLSNGNDIAMFGMNIIKEEYRGKGIGSKMFKRLLEITEGKNTGCTALTNRISFYEQFGFIIHSFTVNYHQGIVKKSFLDTIQNSDVDIIPIKSANFDEVIAYDAVLNTVARPVYLNNWALHNCANGYVALKKGKVVGFGILRPADKGHKMYPLYADDQDIAKALFRRLAMHVPEGEEVIYTSPEENKSSNEIVVESGLKKLLPMTRLYNKKNISVDISKVYSVSSTEFGIV